MQFFSLPTIAILLVAASGCTVETRPLAPSAPPDAAQAAPASGAAWKGLAGPTDEARINRLPEAWSEGLRGARTGRFTAVLREEGSLLVANSALPRPAPTPGSYHCRLIRLNESGPRSPALERYKPFFCYVEVENDLLTIVKQTGTERPAGRLWEDDGRERLIFLGSLASGEREKPKAYGEDPNRDLVGVLERFAPMRWRLLIPFPRSGAKLDVYELSPVPEQPKT